MDLIKDVTLLSCLTYGKKYDTIIHKTEIETKVSLLNFPLNNLLPVIIYNLYFNNLSLIEPHLSLHL